MEVPIDEQQSDNIPPRQAEFLRDVEASYPPFIMSAA